jgi:uncharacterized membrane protein
MNAGPQPRERAFDWLKGLAILFMIQCHALVLLRPELKTDRLYRWLDAIDGLVAPAFLFTAGFTLGLALVRSAKEDRRSARARRVFRRILEVLLVATLLNVLWFPIRSEPQWLLRVDILQCIGISLLTALPLAAALAGRPATLKWLTLGVTVLLFAVSPFAESVRGPMARLANTSAGSVFPLLPWAAYVYLGISVGAVAAAGDRRTLQRWLIGLWILSAGAWQLSPLFLRLYPPHSFWLTDPGNHGQRLVFVLPFTLSSALPLRWIEVFGTSSLAAYFFHQVLLFYPILGFSFDAWWGKRCDWTGYFLRTSALIAATYLLARATDRAYRWLSWSNRRSDGQISVSQLP